MAPSVDETRRNAKLQNNPRSQTRANIVTLLLRVTFNFRAGSSVAFPPSPFVNRTHCTHHVEWRIRYSRASPVYPGRLSQRRCISLDAAGMLSWQIQTNNNRPPFLPTVRGRERKRKVDMKEYRGAGTTADRQFLRDL